MFILRKEQMAMFQKLETQKFVDHACLHVKEFFPSESSALGESKLRDVIQHGIKRAASFNITAKPDVLKYIDLSVLFGPDFDTQFRWADEILNSENSPSVKVEMLLSKAKKPQKVRS